MAYQQNSMEEIRTRFHPRHFLEESPLRQIGKVCILWGQWYIFRESHFYYCRVCDFTFHKECATTLLSNLTINHSKIHKHTLNFIQRKNSFVCDTCGKFDKDQMNMYTCVQCDFFVHKSCILLPRVIKITRHPHRLSHIFYIPNEDFCCGVCRINLEMG
ncbi:hypothetical protein EUTSA_v10019835mg [Eutrema salsugineum]|uniref:DC1 domain-containing protein n=1 Tax=Eutrema salsugineum TaxID=72664 RepID=V4KC47_EUTSA|nr:hypothetical protein EUTSA_v10019835mg [Eutrema salsugineum]